MPQVDFKRDIWVRPQILSGIFLALILILAFWLRWQGMNWGIPQGDHLVASYRSDERTLFTWIRVMQPGQWDFNPHSYFNGTLLLFILAGLYKILSLFDLVTLSQDPLFYYQHVSEWGKFYGFGRLAMISIGVTTVWVIYKAGRYAFGRKVGLLSALLYAIVPLHVVSSKHLLVEPAATFWFALMLYFSFKIIREDSWKDYLTAAFVLASACVVKITCAPLWILVFFSHLLGSMEGRRPSKKLWVSTAVAFFAYFILNPYLLFNLDEVRTEARNWYVQYNAWNHLKYGHLFSLTHMIPYGYGPWFTFGGMAATVICLFSKRREIWLTLIGLAVFFYLNSRTGTVVVKYYVVLLPFLTLLTAYFFSELFKKPALAVRVFAILVFVWMVRETLDLSLAYNRIFLRTDARDNASFWIKEQIPKGSKIALFQEPYWYSPPILYNQYFFTGRNQFWRIEPRYDLVNLKEKEERIKTEKPDYVVLTDREIRMLQRARGDYRKVDDWSYWDAFFSQGGYEKVQTFENRLEKRGIKLSPGFPPDDWQQILLEIRVYKRTALVKVSPMDYSKELKHGITE